MMFRVRTASSVLLAVFLASVTAACAPPPAQTNSNGNVNVVAEANFNSATPGVEANVTNQSAKPAASGGATKGESGMDGVDFAPRITVVERAGEKRIRVEYKVANRTGKPLLVFNQGDTDNLGEDGTVYIEPQADGVVEISQRGWETPAAPSPTQVVYPGATLLTPGASTSKNFELTIAYLAARRPYGSMTPGVAMPRPVRRVRFCLGVAPAEGIQTRTQGEGAQRVLVPDYKAIVTQRLLCSPVQEIE